MGRVFLKIYVGFGILAVLINIISNITTGEREQFLSGDDWFLFIIACSVLAVCETFDKK